MGGELYMFMLKQFFARIVKLHLRENWVGISSRVHAFTQNCCDLVMKQHYALHGHNLRTYMNQARQVL